MSDPRPSNPQPLQEAPLLAHPGLLDQLGLPPKAVRFLRQNQRQAWIITGCIVGLIAAVSLYGSYSSYRQEKAASALTAAMKADVAARPEELKKVAADYSSTDAGLWARIEIAQLALANGETDKAIADLESVRKSIAKDNPLSPLLLANLAGLYENKKEYGESLALYDELSRLKGFEKNAYVAMGRIHEAQGDKDKAVEMYRKYLAPAEGESGAPAPLAPTDPEREMIQARVNSLQE